MTIRWKKAITAVILTLLFSASQVCALSAPQGAGTPKKGQQTGAKKGPLVLMKIQARETTRLAGVGTIRVGATRAVNLIRRIRQIAIAASVTTVTIRSLTEIRV